MLKQKWLWFVVILLLIISIPGLANRWNVETSSNHYEVIIPYNEIAYIADNSDLSIEDVLASLKESGLTTVSFEPASLEEFEKQGVLSVYEESELQSLLLFNEDRADLNIKDKGLYITIPESDEIRDVIESAIEPEVREIAGEQFYFLSKENGHYNIKTPIGYNEVAIELINSHGFLQVLRVKNDVDFVNERIVEQIVSLKSDSVSGLLGSGLEMIGHGRDNQIHLIQQLADAGYYFYSIEGNQLKGETQVARQTNFNVIRLLSVDVNRDATLTVANSVEKAVRAFKERNIKTIFYHISTKPDAVAEESLNDANAFLSSLKENVPAAYSAGKPILFDKILIPSWVMAVVLLAGILFAYLVSDIVRNQIIRLLFAGFMAVIAVAYFLFDRILFTQAFALIIACITPIYAVIKASHGSIKISHILLQYLKAVGISLIGIAIVIGLLNGNGFITGYEVFKGVKMVYVIPILGILMFVYLQLTNVGKNGVKSTLNETVKLLNKEVKYWHLLLFAVVAAIGLFYISRTGNFGPVSNIELMFRQLQEDILYVRPRTKEFLIGFPFFVLALYAMDVNRKLGLIFLIPGVIGFLSIVNTFTHLHIPIGVSLLRTVYSVVLGFVIGLVLILIFNIVRKYYVKAKTRWTSTS